MAVSVDVFLNEKHRKMGKYVTVLRENPEKSGKFPKKPRKNGDILIIVDVIAK